MITHIILTYYIPDMYFNNLDLAETPIIKELCKNIIEDFLKNVKNFNINTEYNLLHNHISNYIENETLSCKNIALKSMSIIRYNEYYKNILDKIELHYDYHPLILICYDIIINHYEKLTDKYIWKNGNLM